MGNWPDALCEDCPQAQWPRCSQDPWSLSNALSNVQMPMPNASSKDDDVTGTKYDDDFNDAWYSHNTDGGGTAAPAINYTTSTTYCAKDCFLIWLGDSFCDEVKTNSIKSLSRKEESVNGCSML